MSIPAKYRNSLFLLFFFLMIRPTPRSTLFPYTTLFRSSNAWLTLSAFHDSPVGIVKTRPEDRKSTRLNSSHGSTSYADFCLKKKKTRLAAGRETQRAAWHKLEDDVKAMR